MIFAILTLLSALSLAAVAGWFSIVGFTTIYAGAPLYAIIMGVAAECAKLVTTSWLYRNWQYSDWRLKSPLIFFTAVLMIITSIGVFGFLSKAHIEQNKNTVDNIPKIEQLDFQINREKQYIADNEKVIAQLDATVNSFLGSDKAERSLQIRRSQAPQRKQLRDEIAQAQKRIDELNTEKFQLESEVRKLQLEVGPIRYIAEIFYGKDENTTENIEAAIKLFTLLIVITLDPLAVVLLIAANHTLVRLKSSKIEPVSNKTPLEPEQQLNTVVEPEQPISEMMLKPDEEKTSKTLDDFDITKHPYLFKVPTTRTPPGIEPAGPQVYRHQPEINEILSEPVSEPVLEPVVDPKQQTEPEIPPTHNETLTTVRIPNRSAKQQQAWAQDSQVLREIIGNNPHFVPKKIKDIDQSNSITKAIKLSGSWLKEFRK